MTKAGVTCVFCVIIVSFECVLCSTSKCDYTIASVLTIVTRPGLSQKQTVYRLEAAHHRRLRRILRKISPGQTRHQMGLSEMTYTVSSGTLNSSIPYHTRKRCQQNTLQQFISHRSLRCLCHVMRMQEDRPARKAMRLESEQKRRSGNVDIRWEPEPSPATNRSELRSWIALCASRDGL